ncbi:ABC transporter substrate-binding protein [Paenibacillus radicis (ex Gao et al. 2016)]|uniref:Iron(3+)-hydroxamate-binding protein YxeB n=1 Tax=Paenibacillus radicis (ex Gao et al. 2016) TaxID=1737354 RepID=A0A917H4B2_9BACL|nr:ABC transporter substrate-binding protein [Paenibacillus radicis (ex Gao et al. 2016)]GGG66967.1 iron(3+)-hydroxamate-binding protein YxeB [Paenibacillus radicis (ex Gao et al. 2016)]
MLKTWNKQYLLLVLVLMVSVLSACGSNSSNSNSTDPSPSAEATAEASPPAAEESATRVFKDGLGREVTIPTHPKKVIALQYLPEMMALETKPAGVASHLLNGFTYMKDQIAGINDIGPTNDPNLEKILELEPDLIITAEWSKDQVESLNKIAPTIVLQWEGQNAVAHFKNVADALGQNDEAETWLKNFNKEAEEARATLASKVEKGETFGAVVIGGFEKGQLRVYGDGNVGYTLFNTLQFPMTDFVQTEWNKGDNELGINLSMEKLPEYASADRLFVVRFDNDKDFLKQVDESSLWKNLPAYKNNKIYTVDADLWFSYDVLSFQAQLKDAVRLLSE